MACLAVPASGCGSEAGGPGIEVQVAPLELPGIVNACYTILVTTPGGDPVWEKAGICADQYGDGSGSITYVGTCDASEPTNMVELVLQDLWDDPSPNAYPLNAPDDYVNPCTGNVGEPRCVLEVPCNENEDSSVTFNLTLMRAARQGFFDIAVNFEDVFCSAKFDTCYADAEGVADPARPLTLLHDPATGERARTAVLGFACSAGANTSLDVAERTHLYSSRVAIFCAAGGFTEEELASSLADQGYTPFVTVDPATGSGGQLYTELDPSPLAGIFQVGIYEGRELLDCDDEGAVAGSCDKVYWNVALGLSGDDFPAGQTCAIQWVGAVSGGALEEGSLPAATTYPVVALSSVLVGPGTGPGSDRVVCQVNPLDGDDSHLGTAYAPMADEGETLSFASELSQVDGGVDTHPVVRRFLSYEEPALHKLLIAIDKSYGRVSVAEQSEIDRLDVWAGMNAAYVEDPEGNPAPFSSATIATSNVRAAYGYYLSSVYAGIARQPEAQTGLIAGTPVVYGSGVTLTSAFEEVGRIAGFAHLIGAVARQPEVAGALASFAGGYTGGMSFNDDPLVFAARVYLAGAIADGIASQPESGGTLVSLALGLIGEPPALPQGETYKLLLGFLSQKLAAASRAQPEAVGAIAQAIFDVTGFDLREGD